MMDTYNWGRFLYRFIVIFILLFVILILLPVLVDQAVYLFSEGIVPRSNSIIVFKDLYGKYEIIGRFMEIIKKLINFM